jgi:hypothetical protein
LVKQFLKFPTIVERPLHIGYEFVGNIDCESPSVHSDVQDMAGVLFSFQAGLAVLTDAWTPAEAERAQSCGPKICGLIPEPLFNVCSGFSLGRHDVYMTYIIRTVKRNLSNNVNAISCEFRDRN